MFKYYLKDILRVFGDHEKVPKTTIRKRLIEDFVIPYECSCCKNKGHLDGLPLTLELHHINGNNRDNRIENLIFMCPNHHAQTESWRRRKT